MDNTNNTNNVAVEETFGNRLGVNRNTNDSQTIADAKKSGYERGEKRPAVTISNGDEQYFGVKINSNLVSKNQIRSNISDKLQQIFNDFIGCNLFLDPSTGQFRLVAFFGPEGLNSEAKYSAFEQILSNDVKDTSRPIFNAMQVAGKAQQIYKMTRNGHGILSDFVANCGPFDKDENGWLKNPNKFYYEVSNQPVTVNGYVSSYYMPQQKRFVWAAVELDITMALKLCKNRIDSKNDKAHDYRYQLTATNSMVVPQVICSYQQQEADFIVELKEIDATELMKMCTQIGVAWPMANMQFKPY